MSVVLPAPLRPTSPNSTPAGTSRLTSDSACVRPKRRDTFCRRMTRSFCIGDSFGPLLAMHRFVTLVDERFHFIGTHIEVLRLGEQRIDAPAQDAQPLAPCQ